MISPWVKVGAGAAIQVAMIAAGPALRWHVLAIRAPIAPSVGNEHLQQLVEKA
jgi:hypothetical protein